MDGRTSSSVSATTAVSWSTSVPLHPSSGPRTCGGRRPASPSSSRGTLDVSSGPPERTPIPTSVHTRTSSGHPSLALKAHPQNFPLLPLGTITRRTLSWSVCRSVSSHADTRVLGSEFGSHPGHRSVPVILSRNIKGSKSLLKSPSHLSSDRYRVSLTYYRSATTLVRVRQTLTWVGFLPLSVNRFVDLVRYGLQGRTVVVNDRHTEIRSVKGCDLRRTLRKTGFTRYEITLPLTR